MTWFITNPGSAFESSWVVQPLKESDLSENVYQEQFLTRTWYHMAVGFILPCLSKNIFSSTVNDTSLQVLISEDKRLSILSLQG